MNGNRSITDEERESLDREFLTRAVEEGARQWRLSAGHVSGPNDPLRGTSFVPPEPRYVDVPADPPRPGPRPLITRADVEGARRDLQRGGAASGERSIAKILGVSRDTVRYALGKDRRRR